MTRTAGEVSSGEKPCVNHPDRKAVWFPFTDAKRGLCFGCYVDEHLGEIVF